MKTFKEQLRRVVDNVHCDCCGKSTTHYSEVGPDYATLECCNLSETEEKKFWGHLPTLTITILLKGLIISNMKD
jgi:hypothetical protein